MVTLNTAAPVCRATSDLRIAVHQCIDRWRDQLAKRAIEFSIDLEVALPVICRQSLVRALVNKLMEVAVARTFDQPAWQSELSLIGYRGENYVELEVADSGVLIDCDGTWNGFRASRVDKIKDASSEELAQMARTVKGGLWVLPCPQGGMAWTLRLPSEVSETVWW